MIKFFFIKIPSYIFLFFNTVFFYTAKFVAKTICYLTQTINRNNNNSWETENRQYTKNEHKELIVQKEYNLTYEEFCKQLKINLKSSPSYKNFQDTDNLLKIIEIVVNSERISNSDIQRKLAIGYAHVAWLLDILQEASIVNEPFGSTPHILLTCSYDEILVKICDYFREKDDLIKSTEQTESASIINLSTISNGIEFEKFCATLLSGNNFSNISITKVSNDYGVDITAEKEDIKYAIQCKFYSSPVGVSSVQEISAGKEFYNCHVAVVMTNSTFTKNATELAQKTKVLLWDVNKINQLIKEMS